MKKMVIAFLVSALGSVMARAELTPQTEFGDVPPNVTISNVVAAAGVSGGGAVQSVNGKTGAVTLGAADVGAYATNMSIVVGDYATGGIILNDGVPLKINGFSPNPKAIQFLSFGVDGYDPLTDLDFSFQWPWGWFGDVLATSNMVESVAQAALDPLAGRVDAAEGTIAAWEHYWDGDDVRFTVTNYFGNLDLPALYIEQKMEPDATHTGDWFKVVWDERTRLAPITNRLTQAEAAIDALDAGKADNGTWGYYDSHAGTVAPEGFVSISAGGVILGNGQTWQKTLVAEGCEVWTLVGSATVAPGTNGVLRLEDTDGTTVFEVVKGGRVTRGATAAAIDVGNAVTITYTLSDAQENPTIQYCTDLVTHDWQTLSADTSTTPHVAWSHEGDTYTATVTLPSPRPERMFFKASYEAGEDGYVKFHSPVDATPGLYVRQGNTRVKIVPVLSGTASGSTVTWKVE